MRIGLDARPALLSRSGISRYVAELVAALARRSGEHSLRLYGDSWRPILEGERSTLVREAARAGSKHRLHRLPIPGRLARLLGPVGYGAESRLGRLDIFHHTDLVFLPVRRAPSVVTVYDLSFELEESFHGAEFRRDVSPRLRAAVAGAQAILTPSEATRRDLERLYDTGDTPIHVTPLAADHLFRTPRASDEEVERLLQARAITGEYILCVGTLEPRKNHERLLNAFEVFARDHEHTLVLIGGAGWLCEHLEARLSEFEKSGRVVRLRGLDDSFLPGLYERASMSIYPSLYEGFGLPVLEAMTCRTATITTQRGSLPEVGGDAVLYCDPEDEASIQQAMARVAEDEQLRHDLEQRGAERARLFSWDRVAEETLAVYRSCLEGS